MLGDPAVCLHLLEHRAAVGDRGEAVVVCLACGEAQYAQHALADDEHEA